jgi:WD40 repeat protein
MLAGCGGSQPSIGAPGAMPQTLASATHADRDKSWMKPGSASGDLLYVADGEGRAFVLTYPQGQLVGQLDFPSTNSGNICSDGDGDIFVPSGYDGEEIWEYAHGGTQPIATLREDSGYPIACAVDPTTGNLAVTNEINYPYKGNVAIYAGAQGDPTYYSDSEIPNPIFCGYDNRGNLFIDGGPFAELPSGSGTFTNIKLNKHIYQGGQVQWDSTYMTVASRNANKIYRLQISGSTGKVVSATLLKGPGRHATSQSWIQGGTIIAPAGRNDDRVGIWNYPTGGKALTIVRLGRRAQVVGATVSVGSNR